jgi:hypothetical protein
MLHDNPAERLRNILDQGRQIGHDVRCRSAWADIFGIDPANGDELYSKLGKVMALPRETVMLLSTNFPRQVHAAKHWRDQVDTAFNNQNLAGQWATFIGHIDHNTVNQLSLTADLIESRLSAKLVPDNDLKQVLSGIHELIAQIDQSDLSVKLKNYLSRELADLQQHVRDYQVSGALPILRQAEALVGHVIVDSEYKDFLASHELGKRLLDNLNAMAAILTVALQLPQLAGIFTAALN